MGKFKESLGINELTQKKGGIWKALLAEFLGTLLLNFFGCASCVSLKTTTPNFVLIGLTFGLTIFIVVQTLGHVSGAHINPAVTAGMLATGNIQVIKAILYIIVQCLGALAGSSILKAVTPENFQGGLGKTVLTNEVTEPQAVAVEILLGFVLVLTVCGVCDPNRPEAKPIAALAIGMAVTLGHLAVVDYTGSSMNPARSFGAALITGDWECHWVYWIGPILGGVAAALIYKHAFAAPSLGPLRLYRKDHPPCEDELAARRRGEPWNEAIKKKLIEKRQLEEHESIESNQSRRKKQKFIPNSNYKDKYAHIIGQEAALDAAKNVGANKSYGIVPSENKKDVRSIEQAMADIRAKKKQKLDSNQVADC